MTNAKWKCHLPSLTSFLCFVCCICILNYNSSKFYSWGPCQATRWWWRRTKCWRTLSWQTRRWIFPSKHRWRLSRCCQVNFLVLSFPNKRKKNPSNSITPSPKFLLTLYFIQKNKHTKNIKNDPKTGAIMLVKMV